MKVRVESADVSDEARQAIAEGLGEEKIKRGTISEYLAKILQKHLEELHTQQVAKDREAEKEDLEGVIGTAQARLTELAEGDEEF